MSNLDLYIKKIKHHMSCSQKTKNRILRDYRETIETFHNIKQLSLNELYIKFDEPRIVAHNLMERVDATELQNYKRFRKIVYCVMAFLFVVAIFISCLFLIKLNLRDNVIVDLDPTEITLNQRS